MLAAYCHALGRPGVAHEAQPAALRNLHLAGEPADVLTKAFGLYGIDVVMTSPMKPSGAPLRIDVDDADLSTAGALLGAMTHCFFVPLSATAVLVLPDTKENRARFERMRTETIRVPNLRQGGGQNAADSAEKASLLGLLTAVFGVPKATMDGDTVTMRVAPEIADQVRETLRDLYPPQASVELEVKAYILSKTRARNLGVVTPQSVTVFNVYTAAESLITSNSSIVEELIEEGLVSAGDTLGIAELLLAGGYGSGSVLGSSSLYFGGGETATGVQFSSSSLEASLTDSTVKELDAATLVLGDGETGKLRVGEKYPVLVATSEAVSTSSTSVSTPSIQYEDLGLTVEAKARRMAGREVAVHLHETIRSLAGSSLNDIPVMNNDEVVTDLTIPDGVTTVVVSNLSRTDLVDLVGFTDAERNVDSARLLITITPVVERQGPVTKGPRDQGLGTKGRVTRD
jgi:general secretion pathway protein D